MSSCRVCATPDSAAEVEFSPEFEAIADPETDPVAQTSDMRFAPGVESFDIVRCRRCLAMTTRVPSSGSFAAPAYPRDYGAFGAPARAGLDRAAERRHRAWGLPHVALHRFAWLADFEASAAPRVLEVGCATGKVALALQQIRGWSAVGIEPDPDAAAAARAAGLHTHTGTLDSFESETRFDVVLFVHVLEHLPDPLAALQRARSLLADGGRLVIALPNAESFERRLFGADWDGWDVPRHLHHFGPEALCGLLRRAGFEPGPVRHEWYALLVRSLGNRWRSDRPYAERRHGFRWLKAVEVPWGLAMAALRTSSAIQVVARVA